MRGGWVEPETLTSHCGVKYNLHEKEGQLCTQTRGEARPGDTTCNGKDSFLYRLGIKPPRSIISTCCFEHGKSQNEMLKSRIARQNTRHQIKFEFQINDKKDFWLCLKYCMGCIYTKKLFIVYLKFKFIWASCIFIC